MATEKMAANPEEEVKISSIDMRFFTVIHTLHKSTKSDSGNSANLIGQLIQQDGFPFTIDGRVRNAMNWSKTKTGENGIDATFKKAGRQPLTWPKLFEALGQADRETPLATDFVAYRLSQLFTTLSKADVAFCLAAETAWQDSSGKFSKERFSQWIDDHNMALRPLNKDGSERTSYKPDADSMAAMIAIAKVIAELRDYRSNKSIADRVQSVPDMLADFTA